MWQFIVYTPESFESEKASLEQVLYSSCEDEDPIAVRSPERLRPSAEDPATEQASAAQHELHTTGDAHFEGARYLERGSVSPSGHSLTKRAVDYKEDDIYSAPDKLNAGKKKKSGGRGTEEHQKNGVDSGVGTASEDDDPIGANVRATKKLCFDEATAEISTLALRPADGAGGRATKKVRFSLDTTEPAKPVPGADASDAKASRSRAAKDSPSKKPTRRSPRRSGSDVAKPEKSYSLRHRRPPQRKS